MMRRRQRDYFAGFIHGALAAVVLCLIVAAARGQNPAADLERAAADLATLDPAAQPLVRYASLSALDRKDWDEALASLSLALNLVSRGPQLVLPDVLVGPTPIVRINLGAYGLPAAVWEQMIEAGEPYWHVRGQVVEPVGGNVVTVTTDGGWAPLDVAADLRTRSQSAGALVRADWLLTRLVSTIDGGLYYEFAGVTDVADASALYLALGIDFAATERLLVEGWALVLRRGPTQKTGRVIHRRGAIGSAWKTEDWLAETPDKDPFREPLRRPHDGSEHFLTKANGLPLMVLADGAGKFVRSAPDALAQDDTRAHGSTILAPALSCVVCHADGLLQPVANDFSRLLAGPVEAYFTSPADAVRAAAVYQRDLDRQLARDREDFEGAVAAVTGGLTVREAGQAAARIYREYTWEQVTPERARRELGLPADSELREWFAVSRDVVLLALAEGLSVQRKQFEASFAEAARLVAGAWRVER